MPKRITTDASAKRIKAPAKGQVAHFVAAYPGLALRCSYRGGKTWVFYYRRHGRQRRMTLGFYPAMSLGDAQDAWREARNTLRAGNDPAAAGPGEARADSFHTVFEEWLKRDQAENRSREETRRVIEVNVLPAWRDKPITDIGRRQCLDLLDAINDRGSTALARRVHAHLHRIFRWALGRGIITTNPMAALDRPAGVERDRWLTAPEIKQLWIATGTLPDAAKAAVRLMVLTGQRVNEIGGLRWSEIDLERDEIHLPAERCKNGLPHIVPLSEQAKAILSAMPRYAGGDYVFGRGGKSPLGGRSIIKSRLEDALGDMPPWQLRDLRRTVSTHLNETLGVEPHIVEAILNHVSGAAKRGVAGTYNRAMYLDRRRAALDAWARHVTTLVEGKGGENVVELRGAGE